MFWIDDQGQHNLFNSREIAYWIGWRLVSLPSFNTNFSLGLQICWCHTRYCDREYPTSALAVCGKAIDTVLTLK